MVERLFLAVPWGCLQFLIVLFPDHTHLLFFIPDFLNLLEKYQLMHIVHTYLSSSKFSSQFAWNLSKE